MEKKYLILRIENHYRMIVDFGPHSDYNLVQNVFKGNLQAASYEGEEFILVEVKEHEKAVGDLT